MSKKYNGTLRQSPGESIQKLFQPAKKIGLSRKKREERTGIKMKEEN